ncbi:MAG: hypothetical protein GY731_06725 [Gammaproteobacteria bacterium]|nr:hypothetical protein [Gammaproteobacteria bacterium]
MKDIVEKIALRESDLIEKSVRSGDAKGLIKFGRLYLDLEIRYFTTGEITEKSGVAWGLHNKIKLNIKAAGEKELKRRKDLINKELKVMVKQVKKLQGKDAKGDQKAYQEAKKLIDTENRERDQDMGDIQVSIRKVVAKQLKGKVGFSKKKVESFSISDFKKMVLVRGSFINETATSDPKVEKLAGSIFKELDKSVRVADKVDSLRVTFSRSIEDYREDLAQYLDKPESKTRKLDAKFKTELFRIYKPAAGNADRDRDALQKHVRDYLSAIDKTEKAVQNLVKKAKTTKKNGVLVYQNKLSEIETEKKTASKYLTNLKTGLKPYADITVSTEPYFKSPLDDKASVKKSTGKWDKANTKLKGLAKVDGDAKKLKDVFSKGLIKTLAE